jgi:uncharacterized membrane protein YfcA
VLVVALLYSSVGHAGASGYIAVMSLFGLAPAVIKPTALVLNILVAVLASSQFWRAGHFSWRLFWPFALAAVPFAFLGGYANLPVSVFKAAVGLILLFSAARFLIRPPGDLDVRDPPVRVALLAGAGLGLLSGLTGTGGGIFLTPLLLFAGWARPKRCCGIGPFILLNSISGPAGNVMSTSQLPAVALPLAVAALAGGSVGSYFGSTRLANDAIKRLLALVLLIAGTKLLVYG